VGRGAEDSLLMAVSAVRYYVDFDDSGRVEVYDALDAIRRLDRPGRILQRVDGGPLETVGWWTDNGYQRNPAFRPVAADGVTPVLAEDR